MKAASIPAFLLSAGLAFFHLSMQFSENNNHNRDIPAPMVLSPLSGSTVDSGQVFFLWRSLGQNISYELLLADNPEFLDAKKFLTPDTFSLHILTGDTAQLFWKLRAFIEDKEWGEWSPDQVLYVRKPQKKIFLAPCGRVGGCSGCPYPCGRRPPEDKPVDF